ncbi:unnamed protein product [Dovyalis caffra]|uniref:Endonuclease/exonuclease/phosphatase domain-containing protein n=1 Tax=Dovyalis caffra TaxID=77055 RepID=A0AAV1RCA3_9ROSI|nr:unnamed protein product [Dovyalis caffra]
MGTTGRLAIDWIDLLDLHSNNSALIIGGDFNILLYQWEKRRGLLWLHSREVRSFSSIAMLRSHILDEPGSNHRPILLNTDLGFRTKRQFKYDDRWAHDADASGLDLGHLILIWH